MANITEPGSPPYGKPHRPQCGSCTMRGHWDELHFACLPEGLSLCTLVHHLERTDWAGIALPSEAVTASTVPECGPHFDPDRRELSLDGVVVRQFHRAAANQISILKAFRKHGWPAGVDNALGRPAADDVRHRLSDAINELNQHQTPKLIHFWV